MYVLRTTISDNSGGDFGNGVGIYNEGSVTVENSTITRNRASFGSGGGLFNANGGAALISSTVTDNSSSTAFIPAAGGIVAVSGTVTLSHSIVAANRFITAASGPRGFLDCSGVAGAVVSHGYNIVGRDTGCPADGVGDQVIEAEAVFTGLLGPLADNGGPTETHALLHGSPAIDGGNPAGCRDQHGRRLRTDQRGVFRPQDGLGTGFAVCDIGAFELQAGDVP